MCQDLIWRLFREDFLKRNIPFEAVFMKKDNHLISCRKQFIFSNDNKDFNLFDPERILEVAPANNERSSEFDVMFLFDKRDRIDLEQDIHLFPLS